METAVSLCYAWAMELHHLRTFVIVAEEQSITRAAQRLYATPPSVSAHIKALEAELNVQLFVRTAKGMQITEKGVLLKAKAEQTLQAAQDLVNHATEMQSHLLGPVRCGLNASARFLQIPQLTAQLQEGYPGIQLHLEASSSGKILRNLAQGGLDMGFVFGAAVETAVVHHYLTTVTLVVAAPAAYAPQLAAATWADVAALPWIYAPDYCPFQTIIDDVFQSRGLTYQRAVVSGDEATKQALVAAGIGLTLLEKSEVEVQGGEGIVVWPTDPIECDLSLAVARQRQRDPLINAVLGVVQALDW